MTAMRSRTPLAAAATAALLLTHLTAPTATPAPRPEAGGGWDEVVCGACVAAGTVVLFSGAAGWGVLLANPSLTGGVIGMCLNACRSAIKEAQQ
ncbi:MAG: hypothetical protein KJT01_17320 [Gemmatimonadetes bacterium]|nr:hypothetical protein [Gemmatimonadota bacterium]